MALLSDTNRLPSEDLPASPGAGGSLQLASDCQFHQNDELISATGESGAAPMPDFHAVVAAEVARQLAAAATPAQPPAGTNAGAATALVRMLSVDDGEMMSDDPDHGRASVNGARESNKAGDIGYFGNPLHAIDAEEDNASEAHMAQTAGAKLGAEEDAAAREQFRSVMDKMTKRVIAKMHEATPNLHQATVAICLDSNAVEHDAPRWTGGFFLFRSKRKAIFLMSSFIVVALQTAVMLGVLIGVSHPSCLPAGHNMTIWGVNVGPSSLGRATQCPPGDFCARQRASANWNLGVHGFACEFCLDVHGHANGHPSWVLFERHEWAGVVNGTYDDVLAFCSKQNAQNLTNDDFERCQQCFDPSLRHATNGWNTGRSINDALIESVAKMRFHDILALVLVSWVVSLHITAEVSAKEHDAMELPKVSCLCVFYVDWRKLQMLTITQLHPSPFIYDTIHSMNDR
jgi:hypothetical protein